MLTFAMILRLLDLLAFAAGATAAEPGVAIPQDLIVQEFAVAKGGDLLLVPVRIAGKDHQFVVETGASGTVFDLSLLSTEPRKVTQAIGAEKELQVTLYDPPDASVGKIPLRFDGLIVGMDLKRLRAAAGYPIEGVLGMDFLSQYVLHIDFDNGRFLLLKSAPENVGKAIPIVLESLGRPTVAADVGGKGSVQFMIDTGSGGDISGTIHSRLRRERSGKEDFREVTSNLIETATGASRSAVFLGNCLKLGEFTVYEPLFLGSQESNALGLGFWSRFTVTLDFPKRVIYLAKGLNYSRPDLSYLSGLSLVSVKNAVVVQEVQTDSRAETAGFRTGDVLLRLGKHKTEESSLFELQRALCQPEKLICIVRRGSREHRLTLDLSE